MILQYDINSNTKYITRTVQLSLTRYPPAFAASIAGGFAARQVVSCSAASSQSRVAFLVQAGLVAGAAVASAASPVIALAEGDGEEEEVQVGKEVTTGSGLKYVVTVAGKGAKPNPGDTIKAHYTGECVSVTVAALFECNILLCVFLLSVEAFGCCHTERCRVLCVNLFALISKDCCF